MLPVNLMVQDSSTKSLNPKVVEKRIKKTSHILSAWRFIGAKFCPGNTGPFAHICLSYWMGFHESRCGTPQIVQIFGPKNGGWKRHVWVNMSPTLNQAAFKGGITFMILLTFSMRPFWTGDMKKDREVSLNAKHDGFLANDMGITWSNHLGPCKTPMDPGLMIPSQKNSPGSVNVKDLRSLNSISRRFCIQMMLPNRNFEMEHPQNKALGFILTR